jgi:3-methyladenine DNA glycosylase/8-oxoguanine DNA glycosylase
VHYPEISNLNDLDRVAERWKPHRGWAARLLWLDLLGHDASHANDSAAIAAGSTQHIP